MSRLLFVFVLSVLFVSFKAHAASFDNKNKDIIWAGCGITKKAFMQELAKAYEAKTGIHINLQGGGATKGIRQAVKGEISIGGACRPIMEDHSEERSAYQIPVAWDALVVIVNKNNPVDNISLEQVRSLYRGKIKNWNKLGGSTQPLELYVRRGKLSGVGRTLREIVFANYDQAFRGKHVMKSSGPLEKGIEQNPNGIGVTGISSAKRRDVKILKLEGHAPSYENIKKGDYLLYRPLYLVTQSRVIKDQRVKDFITFALSSEGRDIIRNTGTVPYSDAIGLVMKQVQQYEQAAKKGLYD